MSDESRKLTIFDTPEYKEQIDKAIEELSNEIYNSLNIKKIKHSGFTVFDTKKEMLDYLDKMSFQTSDPSKYYKAVVMYIHRKWIVKWEEN